jgi:hypothetical protein
LCFFMTSIHTIHYIVTCLFIHVCACVASAWHWPAARSGSGVPSTCRLVIYALQASPRACYKTKDHLSPFQNSSALAQPLRITLCSTLLCYNPTCTAPQSTWSIAPHEDSFPTVTIVPQASFTGSPLVPTHALDTFSEAAARRSRGGYGWWVALGSTSPVAVWVGVDGIIP